MNENHDPKTGEFSSGGGGLKAIADKGVAKFQAAHQKLDALRDKIHNSRAYQELAVKDRFTKLVPPGSKRDKAVKQAAMWAEAGLQKAAVVAAGGGAAGAAGVTVAAYTKYGGTMAREYGPKIRASKFGQKLAQMLKRGRSVH